jgi:hypothetical protein
MSRVWDTRRNTPPLDLSDAAIEALPEKLKEAAKNWYVAHDRLDKLIRDPEYPGYKDQALIEEGFKQSVALHYFFKGALEAHLGCQVWPWEEDQVRHWAGRSLQKEKRRCQRLTLGECAHYDPLNHEEARVVQQHLANLSCGVLPYCSTLAPKWWQGCGFGRSLLGIKPDRMRLTQRVCTFDGPSTLWLVELRVCCAVDPHCGLVDWED